MVVSQTSDHIQIKIKMPNPCQEPSASSKATNKDLKGHGCFLHLQKQETDAQIHNVGISKTSGHIQFKIKIHNSSQEPPKSLKGSNHDLKHTDILCTFKVKIESQNSEYGWTEDQWPYQNQYQDAKPKSGTSSALQSPKWGLKGHGCSLHLQNQDREPKFRSWVCQRPVTIFKSRSRCQTPVRKIQHLLKPQMRT